MAQDDMKQTTMLFFTVSQANAEIVLKIDHDRLLCSLSLQIIVPFDITSCSQKNTCFVTQEMTPRNVLLLATFEVILAALLKIQVLEDVRPL